MQAAHQTGHGSRRRARRPILSRLVTGLSRLGWPSWAASEPSHWRPPAPGLVPWATETHDDVLSDESEFAAAAAADMDTVLGTSAWELVWAPEADELERLAGSFYPSVRGMAARRRCRFERLGWGRELTGVA